MDFVAIEPFTVPFLSIGMGQRYDILVTANQPSQNYWLRAIPQSTCSDNDNTDNIKAIVRYEYSSTVDPTTEAYEMPDDCDDELMASLVPALPLNVGTTFTDETASATLSLSEGYFRWEIAPGPMQVEWNDPSLLQIYNNATHWNSSENIIELLQANAWVFLVIQNTNSVAHPIHLHGHDFYVLAQSTGIYTTSSTISTNNPPRRDVAMLPGSGYMVIAFLTDNPGAWLLHCHIGLHAAMGFALQFIEREPEIRSLIDYDTLSDTCDSWTSYATSYNVEEDDSGV
jgi:FtsP/CotA-like multicopper oxidase with cupredoxin domain